MCSNLFRPLEDLKIVFFIFCKLIIHDKKCITFPLTWWRIKKKHEAVNKRNFNRFYMYISETNEWNKAV